VGRREVIMLERTTAWIEESRNKKEEEEKVEKRTTAPCERGKERKGVVRGR